MDSTNSTKENGTATESNKPPTDSKETDWDTVGHVAASDHRTSVLDVVGANGPTTPTQISDNTALDVTHVSRSLGALQDRGLVEVLNPDARKGRLYQLTETGETILEKVNEVSA